MMNETKEGGATGGMEGGPPQAPRATALGGLRLTEGGDFQPVKLYPDSSGFVDEKDVRKALSSHDVWPEVMPGGVAVWRDLDAVLEDDAKLNHGAVQLIYDLRGAAGLPHVFGPVLITGWDRDAGKPVPLSWEAYGLLRSAWS